jgi:hypothetical protein
MLLALRYYLPPNLLAVRVQISGGLNLTRVLSGSVTTCEVKLCTTQGDSKGKYILTAKE